MDLYLRVYRLYCVRRERKEMDLNIHLHRWNSIDTNADGRREEGVTQQKQKKERDFKEEERQKDHTGMPLIV